MKRFSVPSAMLSVVAGATLALGLFFSVNATKATAEDWCQAPPGCAFGGCFTRNNAKTCSFYKIDNNASCSSHPACGTAPSGGGGSGEIGIDLPPEN